MSLILIFKILSILSILNIMFEMRGQITMSNVFLTNELKINSFL